MLEIITITKAWDDKVRAETGEKVEAAGSFVLEWDGERRVLDLTELSYKEIDELVRPLLLMGRKDDGKTGKPKTGKGRNAGRKPTIYYTEMQRFASESDGEYTYKVNSEGKFDYPQRLRDAFEASGMYAAIRHMCERA